MNNGGLGRLLFFLHEQSVLFTERTRPRVRPVGYLTKSPKRWLFEKRIA